MTKLDLSGRSVTTCDFDHLAVIRFSGGYEIGIENDFRVSNPAGQVELSPGVDPDRVARFWPRYKVEPWSWRAQTNPAGCWCLSVTARASTSVRTRNTNRGRWQGQAE